MSGALFTPPPYRRHTAHIIKQSDESRAPTVPYADDLELFGELRPSTIYMVRIVLFITGTSGTTVWKPVLSQTADFACLINHRAVGSSTVEEWYSAAAGNHLASVMDTTRFNDPASLFPLGNDSSRRCLGMIKTGSAGGTFSIRWGNGVNTTRTMHAGSFMLLQEAASL